MPALVSTWLLTWPAASLKWLRHPLNELLSNIGKVNSTEKPHNGSYKAFINENNNKNL